MNCKKILTILLSITLIAGTVPSIVFAEESPDEEQIEAASEEADEEITEEAPEEVAEAAAEEAAYGGVVGDSEQDPEEPVLGNTRGTSASSIFGPRVDGCYNLTKDSYVLTDNVTIDGRLVVEEGRNVVIDLNTHTISRGLTQYERDEVGGGVAGVEPGATLTVVNGKITGGSRSADDKTTGNGGGFNVNGTLILEDVEVYDNHATECGGGIYIAGQYASATLRGNCSIHDNVADGKGDGIYVDHGGSLRIEGSPFVKYNGLNDVGSNVYLAAGHNIEVTGTLTKDADIGVTYEDEGLNAITESYGGFNRKLSPDEVFFSDYTGVKPKVILDGDEAWFSYDYVTRYWDSEAKTVKKENCVLTKYIPLDKVEPSSDHYVDLINDNCYIVREDLPINDVVRCFISPSILVFDDKTLTCSKGIIVEGGNSLSIYFQSEETGRLLAMGYENSAGIGGGNGKDAGHINIYGGNIEATGAEYGAGIGGGNDASCGVVSIFGGTVKADGGDFAPGIGSGQAANDLGTINIYDGNITAQGNTYAAGIGSGGKLNSDADIESGNIRIYGGVIDARGGNCGTCIGGGRGSTVNMDITISGGEVTAIANCTSGVGAAGIGSAGESVTYSGSHFEGNITITGGTVIAHGSGRDALQGAAGIGSGYEGNMTGTITISGGTVEALGTDGGSAIGAGGMGHCKGGIISITGGTLTLGLDRDDNQTCPAIGHGSGEVIDGGNGNLTIADDLCVSINDSSLVYSAYRVSKCQQEGLLSNAADRLHIEPCTHGSPITRTYTSLDDIRHSYRCRYCESVSVEEHDYFYGKCIRCEHEGVGIAHLEGYSLSLDGDIAVNFYMELSDLYVKSSTSHMHFDLPGGTSEDMYLDKAEIKTLDGKTYYVFKCRVSAKQVNSEIKASFVDHNETIGEYNLTVKQYAEALIARTGDDTSLDRATKDLANALVNYCAYAQSYFGVTGGVTPDPDAISSVIVAKRFAYDAGNNNLPDTVAYAGSSLTLLSETTLSIYLDTKEALSNVTCVDENNKVYTCDVENAGRYKVLRVRGLAVTNLERFLTIEFTVGDGAQKYHVSYYPLTYCHSVCNGGYNQSLTYLCKALYKFYDEANTYLKLTPDNT